MSFVPLESIDWIESGNNCAKLHCGARNDLLGEALARLEERLDPDRFLHGHRCHIVNVAGIAA